MSETLDPNATQRTLRLAVDHGWLIDAADLLGEPDPGPTPWLVEGLIVDQAIVALVGKWKTTKSYGLLDILISIATGRPAFGRLVIPNPGPVIYLAEESGRAAMWRRLDALCRGRGVDPEELRGNLHVSANAHVKLDDPRWQEEMIDVGKELRPRLIAFDPLARMKDPGRNENAQNEMAGVLEYLRLLRDVTQAASLFVQHTGHEGTRMRGSSDLESVWETRLTWVRDEGSSVVTIKSEHREAEGREPIQYRIAWDGLTRSMRFDLVEADGHAAHRSAFDWIGDYVETHPGLPKGEVEEAFGRHHGSGGRRLARQVIDKQLAATDGESTRIALGPGKSPSGKYLYPASPADSPPAVPPVASMASTAGGVADPPDSPTRHTPIGVAGGESADAEAAASFLEALWTLPRDAVALRDQPGEL